jgi:hypothetical protein
MFFQDSPHIYRLHRLSHIWPSNALYICFQLKLCLIQDLIRCGLGSEHYWIHSMWLCSPLYWSGKPCFLQSITHQREFQCFIFLDFLLFEANSIFRTGYVSHCRCSEKFMISQSNFFWRKWILWCCLATGCYCVSQTIWIAGVCLFAVGGNMSMFIRLDTHHNKWQMDSF